MLMIHYKERKKKIRSHEITNAKMQPKRTVYVSYLAAKIAFAFRKGQFKALGNKLAAPTS